MQLPALNQHKECHNHSDIQYEPLLNSTYDDESVVDILNDELGFSKYKVNNNRTLHSFWKFLALFNGACLIVALYYIFVHINKVTDENSIYETYEIEFTKPPMNCTRNYSSNINEIWNDYFDGKRPEKLQCQKFFDDDKKAMSAYNSSGRLTATEKQELRLAMDCESIRRRVMGNNTYPKLERTIAVARNIFMNYPLQEAFLSFAYHPDNFYCYVMDSKSNASFVKRMKALGECLPNVFIMEKMFNMDSSGHYQDHGHFLCMKTLIERDSKWQHILLLQNFDMIVRTTKEIVEMSKIFNGTQSIQVVGPIYGRYDNKANWTPKGLKLWKNETGKTKAQLETKLDIGKGNNEAFLSRDFVEAIFKELNVDNILNRFNDLKKYGTDEMLIQTLAINSWMGLSGQIPNHCHKSLKGFTRYTHWIFSKTADGCKGKVRRHNVCLMGVEYLPRMKGYWEIAVNKVHPEYDFGSIMCMGEYLHNIEVGITKRDFNTNSYKESPQVRQMELIRLGKYDAKNFKCS